jgi:hypothetical protein
MANDSGGGSGTPFLAFLVGGLLVAVVVLGFFMVNGHNGSVTPDSHISMNIKAPNPVTPHQ